MHSYVVWFPDLFRACTSGNITFRSGPDYDEESAEAFKLSASMCMLSRGGSCGAVFSHDVWPVVGTASSHSLHIPCTSVSVEKRNNFQAGKHVKIY